MALRSTQGNGYVVEDNIEYTTKNAIPLWIFGLNY